MIFPLYNDFKKLRSVPKAMRPLKVKVERYSKSLEESLDIRAEDISFRKKQEKIHIVKESKNEEDFWEDQMKGKRLGYCDSFVDKKWLSADTRRKKGLDSFLKRLGNQKWT